MIRKALKKIFIVNILFVFLTFTPTYACGVSCKDGVCTEASCGTNCGCGCKQKFWQTWEFWTILGAAGLISLSIYLSRNYKFEKVKAVR